MTWYGSGGLNTDTLSNYIYMHMTVTSIGVYHIIVTTAGSKTIDCGVQNAHIIDNISLFAEIL